MKEENGGWLNSRDSKEYFALLAMPTVGADPKRLADCVRAATWLKEWLAATGAEASLRLPNGADRGGALPVPVVTGVLPGDPDAPTVLFYGHYDVQPPDPLDLWETPPFEPTVRGDRVYCRGAQDDKGQFFAFLCGLRSLVEERKAKIPTVKFVIDGQEESGSPTLFRLLEDREFRREITADVMLVCDTGAGPDLRPAIVAGLRGVNHFTVALKAANRDLHSGEYGGIAPNAAQGMAELLASLHSPDGSIAVEGFCDGAEPPTAEELAAAEAGFPSASGFEKDIGTAACGGERAKSHVVRGCFDPTIEINGVHSGYGGPGSKTVIPCEAVAKISTRLAAGQIPSRSFEALKKHLREKCPQGMEVSFPEDSGLSAAMKLPLGSPVFRLAEETLSAMDPRGPAYLWDGASIPVVSSLRDATCAAPLIVGWGQPEDRIHSPNESFSLRQFAAAKEWARRILAALAG